SSTASRTTSTTSARSTTTPTPTMCRTQIARTRRRSDEAKSCVAFRRLFAVGPDARGLLLRRWRAPGEGRCDRSVAVFARRRGEPRALGGLQGIHAASLGGGDEGKVRASRQRERGKLLKIARSDEAYMGERRRGASLRDAHRPQRLSAV